jgi:hypothetical protein
MLAVLAPRAGERKWERERHESRHIPQQCIQSKSTQRSNEHPGLLNIELSKTNSPTSLRGKWKDEFFGEELVLGVRNTADPFRVAPLSTANPFQVAPLSTANLEKKRA